MIRSRDKRNQRLRRATRQRAPRDHRDEPLHVLVCVLAREAARERFEREIAVEPETPRKVTVQ